MKISVNAMPKYVWRRSRPPWPWWPWWPWWPRNMWWPLRTAPVEGDAVYLIACTTWETKALLNGINQSSVYILIKEGQGECTQEPANTPCTPKKHNLSLNSTPFITCPWKHLREALSNVVWFPKVGPWVKTTFKVNPIVPLPLAIYSTNYPLFIYKRSKCLL